MPTNVKQGHNYNKKWNFDNTCMEGLEPLCFNIIKSWTEASWNWAMSSTKPKNHNGTLWLDVKPLTDTGTKAA